MNLNLVAPINTTSYGYTSLHFLKSLTKQDVKVALFPIPSSDRVEVTDRDDFEVVKVAVDNAKFFHTDAPCVRLWHQFDMAQFVGRSTHIGFPIFELDKFNDMERHHLSSLDKIFVTSEWAAGVIAANKIEVPTYVVPLGIDPNIFKFASQTPTSGKTIFFNCGKWEVRKGHDILITAFQRAFRDSDLVELWMMCTNQFNTPQENSYWTAKYDDPRVRLLPRVKTQQDVYNIMLRTDCGVFPSRAEGWNLELLEMMACGKQVIATDCTAHTEFCNKENCHLLHLDDMELAFDGKWFHGQGNWYRHGNQSINDLADLMRSIHEKKQRGDDLVNYAALETAKQFTWDNSARKMVEYA